MDGALFGLGPGRSRRVCNGFHYADKKCSKDKTGAAGARWLVLTMTGWVVLQQSGSKSSSSAENEKKKKRFRAAFRLK